jgi:hypothetical protein
MADYVLADSWFINEPFLNGIKSLGKNIQTIGIMKTDRSIEINDQKQKFRGVIKKFT